MSAPTSRTPRAPWPLPAETIPPAGGRQVLAVVVAVSLLVALANAAAGFLLRQSPRNLGYWLIERKWALVRATGTSAETLVVGDSSGNQGVVTSQLGAALGGGALNACTIGILTAANDAWMLAAHLRAGNPPPRRVVVVHVWDVWRRNDGVGFLQALSKVPLPIGELRALDPSPRLSGVRLARLWLGRSVPLYAEHESLVELLSHPGSPPAADPSTLDATGYMRWDRSVDSLVTADVADRLALARSKPFLLSDVNRRALEELRSLAQEFGFELYMVNGPVHEEVARDAAWRAQQDALDAILSDFDASSERVHYLLREPAAFPSSAMSNADHLLHAAAEQYTRAIASAIASEEAHLGPSGSSN